MSANGGAIAPVSPDNNGPWNTIAAIFLIVASLLISVVRYVISQRRTLTLGFDDAVFGVGLLIAIVMSLVSQQMVQFGLGRHIKMVSAGKLETFYRLHYASHLLAVLSMTCSKTSIVLMFRRIIPTEAPLTTKLLLPVVLASGIASIFLVGFQCQLPQPWILEPLSCSTGGRVHYATTALNILTDVMTASWIIRPIWKLQMTRGTRIVVITLLVSRLIVCVCDVAKITMIDRALQSEDTTWVFLSWILMDQVVVHLSLNHASLPRVHVFLRNLQTGLAVSRVAAGGDITRTGNGYESGSRRPFNESDQKTSRVTALETTAKTSKSVFFKSFKSNTAAHSVNQVEDDQSSEIHLRLEPERGTEMSTFVTVGDNDSTSSKGNMRTEEKVERDNSWELQGFGDKDNYGRVPAGQIKIEQTVEIKTERGL